MRRGLHIVFLPMLCLAVTACRTVPQEKPLTELTEAEQIAYNQHAALEKPKAQGSSIEFVDVVKTAGVIIVYIPILVWESLAWNGTQFSMGK